MSQKKTFVVTNGNSRIIHIRKNSPPKKSGILERHTYKTDNGHLLPGTSSDSNHNKTVGSTNSINRYPFFTSRPSKCLLSSSNSVPPQGCSTPEKILVKNKNLTKSENLNTVRTEHCDSTTDIDIVLKNKRRSISKQNDSDSESSNSDCVTKNYKIKSKKRVIQQNSNPNYESDSDCQIVDVKTVDQPLKRRTLQMEWMIIANKSPKIDSVEVISDSDSDSSDLQSNQLTSSNQNLHQRKKSTSFASDESNDSKKDDQLEPSVYEISDGIQIVLPPIGTDNSSKPRIEIHSNVVQNSKNGLKKRMSSESETDSSHVTSSEMHLSITPTDFAPKSPKYDPTLSPESMKTEFYSYLKINTNPLAPKVETGHQNRRSTRVKKLIEESEKIREKNEKLKEELMNKKREEIRAKFLKFSPRKINLPSLDNSKIKDGVSDFEDFILKYFTKEGINYKSKNDEKENNPEKNSSPKLDTGYERKLLYQKIFSKDNKENKTLQKPQRKSDESVTKPISKEKKSDESMIKAIASEKKSEGLQIKSKQQNRIEEPQTKASDSSSKENKQYIKPKPKIPQKVALAKGRSKRIPCTSKQIYLNKTLLKRKQNLNLLRSLERSLRSRNLPRTRNKIFISQKLQRKVIKPSILKNKKKIQPKDNTNRETDELVAKVEKPSLTVLDKLDLITQSVMKECALRNEEDLSDIEVSEEEIVKDNAKEKINKIPEEEHNMSDKVISNIKAPESPNESCIGFTPDNNIQQLRKSLKSVLTGMLPTKNNVYLKEPICSLLQNVEIFEKESGVTSPKQPEYEVEDSAVSTQSEVKDTPVVVSSQNNIEIVEPSVLPELFNSDLVKSDKVQNYIPLDPNVIKKSFHQSLIVSPKKKCEQSSSKSDPLYSTNSNFSFMDEDTQTTSISTTGVPKKSRTHEIDIQKQNGPVFNAYYVNCTLIIVQELLISFWKQTPLGNILGAQNMWYSIGNIKRLTLERGCINRRSTEMVLNVDSSVAYVELWTKEHQSDYRERPVTDVFATVYYHKGHGLPDKKVLQLENIKGFGNDVRFAIMKNSREIVVSWFETFSEPAKAIIRSYQLAPDFQSISSTKEMESVEHFVLSLHNIGNCDTLVLGAGSEQISIWNLTHGWLSTTVSFDTSSAQIHSMCLWAHCETGYLFLLQQIGRGILRLVAVNGVSSQWKQLQIYHVPENYESLLGVTIESGILMTCYPNGFVCYDTQSGELLADTETPINGIILPSEKFLVILDDFKISVKHVMIYVLEN